MRHLVDVPLGLSSEEFLLRPIRASDAERDFEAVMESKEHLRVWEQSTWPADDFTVDSNRLDLERLVKRHSDGDCFTFSILTPDETACLGCAYIFPSDAALFEKRQIKSITGSDWSIYPLASYFWVRQSRLADELDRRVLFTICRWLANEWRAPEHLVITNAEYDHQVKLIENAGLARAFELHVPDKPFAEFAYASIPGTLY